MKLIQMLLTEKELEDLREILDAAQRVSQYESIDLSDEIESIRYSIEIWTSEFV